ncbi:cytidylyltransferase domain-containing protein [Janthinobacterium agaricidamnosum]|uniref:Cytidylyltransferase family protein n=1 Tax=Janthinobacterium agaricidamnosum NBRC 102515 = DSM 9628 TaxID=1349767 RepID=W0UYF7_9BURK|nr:glycosyltransferase family protein [Janthinobacterium agaricidamnosum]CDG81589.1 cytidylyltransferase family protein [Janthinobacterium agaricidamnosum NBRC 102515 = DSM 9628]
MILAILQARVSSSRLPGKVLKPLLGVPMLIRQIERLRGVSRIDQLLVATSNESSDDAIEELCRAHGVACFRGDLNDVLERFHQAAQTAAPEHIVRLTADCPLTDAALIDQVIEFYLDGDYDYASNSLEATYPDGLDVEIFRASCLEQAWQEARLPSQREHVTPFINQQPQRYKIGLYRGATDLSHLRWTVDEPKDFELVTMIYEALYPDNSRFSMQDVLSLLERRPELADWNTMHERNEGYQKSLDADAAPTTIPHTKEN